MLPPGRQSSCADAVRQHDEMHPHFAAQSGARNLSANKLFRDRTDIETALAGKTTGAAALRHLTAVACRSATPALTSRRGTGYARMVIQLRVTFFLADARSPDGCSGAHSRGAARKRPTIHPVNGDKEGKHDIYLPRQTCLAHAANCRSRGTAPRGHLRLQPG